jgi:hypothetical protein
MRDTSKATHKGRDDEWDEREAAVQGRQQREGGDNPREAMLVALSLLTQRAFIVILLVINTLFSNFNDVDLLHIMLVDCCMLCCQEWGPIGAV